MHLRRALLPALAAMLGGCALPIPTSYVAAPSVRGTVVHSQTGEPVDLAAVTVKDFREASAFSKRDGSFATDTITRSKPFWIWNPFSKPKIAEVKLRIVRSGFEKREKVVKWTAGEQRMVHLAKPIRLRPKGLAAVVADETRGE